MRDEGCHLRMTHEEENGALRFRVLHKKRRRKGDKDRHVQCQEIIEINQCSFIYECSAAQTNT